jgi:hypothetical protein
VEVEQKHTIKQDLFVTGFMPAEENCSLNHKIKGKLRKISNS